MYRILSLALIKPALIVHADLANPFCAVVLSESIGLWCSADLHFVIPQPDTSLHCTQVAWVVHQCSVPVYASDFAGTHSTYPWREAGPLSWPGWVGYIHTSERLPIPVLTWLIVEQLCLCDHDHRCYHRPSHQPFCAVIKLICGVTVGYIRHCRQASRCWRCLQRIQNHWRSTSPFTCEVQYSFGWMLKIRHFLVTSSAYAFCCHVMYMLYF